MKSRIGHIYLYVTDLKESYDFYSKFLTYLGYRETVNQDWGFAYINDGTSMWFENARRGHVEKGYHRKRIGLNHLAFRVGSKEEVDKFCKEFLETNNIKPLYDSPKEYPEYEQGYYAVYFEDPDRIKLEVAYYP